MKSLVLGALLACAAGTAMAQQAGVPQDVQDVLAKLSQIPKDNAADPRGAKGWTCRDMDDGGKRLHRVDPTGIARMNGVPSSQTGLMDAETPLEQLPACAEPS
ncbi:hypothetical protein WJ972_21325 [Achromobacter insuavis]